LLASTNRPAGGVMLNLTLNEVRKRSLACSEEYNP
jgi:hypothetical protein